VIAVWPSCFHYLEEEEEEEEEEEAAKQASV